MTSSTWRRRGSGSGSVTGTENNIFLDKIKHSFYSRRQKEKRTNPDFEVCTVPSDVNSDSSIDRHLSLKPNTLVDNPESLQGLDLKIKVSPKYNIFSAENLHINSEKVCS